MKPVQVAHTAEFTCELSWNFQVERNPEIWTQYHERTFQLQNTNFSKDLKILFNFVIHRSEKNF